MNNLRVIFMGTPDFAVPVLESLIKKTNVILVVSQPDKMVGRTREIKYTPIKETAVINGIPSFQPECIKTDYQRIIELNPDIIITCAYGQILPEEILTCSKYGCINVHASLLPKLRGGAPIHHAIIDGEEKTGITIMYMDRKMDTGDIISQKEYYIKEEDNVGTLHDTLSNIGAELLIETLPSIIDGTNKRISQNEDEATYAWNITRKEEHLDFNQSSREIFNKVRGLNPFPKAYAVINEQEVKIIACEIGNSKSTFSPGTICEITKDKIGVATKDKIVYITELKPFGKKQMPAKDFINGVKKDKLLHTIVE